MSGYACFPVGQLQANCWLLWDDDGHALLIDPGDESERLLRALRDRELTLSAIVLTHAHFDHMMAVPALQEATGAPLFVHEADVPALSDDHKSLTSWVGVSCRLVADRVLHGGESVTVGDITLEVVHTPGHTPGSCCFRWGTLLFTGDTLFVGSVGRTDFPGGDPAVLCRSLQQLKALPDDWMILPGHEGVGTLGNEKKTNPFMV